MSLTDKHLADLRASGLTDETVAAAGLYSETDGDQVRALLGEWHSAKTARGMGPCLAFVYHDPAGEPMTYADAKGESRPFVRLKPDSPRADRKEKGKPIKYESPAGASPRAYFPPGTRAAVLADPAVELVITEGEKKGLCADQHGVPCIAIGGVWSWQQKREEDERGNKAGPRLLIPDLKAVNWKGRKVTICFDSDAAAKPIIQFAEWHLAECLAAEGAVVTVARLPAEPDGAKNGIDDFVVRHGPESLKAVIAAATPPSKPAAVGEGQPNDAIVDPHRNAEKFLTRVSPEGPPYLIRSWRDDFWLYTRGAYVSMAEGDLKAWLADFLRAVFVQHNIDAVTAWRNSESSSKRETPPETPQVTTGLLNNVIQALRGACLLSARTDPPAWIDCPPGPDPTGILAMSNGLLDLEAAVRGRADCLLPPDPHFFTTTAVPFAYDADAPKPVEWLKFLHSIWPDDLDSIACLQEWFGYSLTVDTRQQKILLFVGRMALTFSQLARPSGV